jgi:hypothetical protein
MPHDSKDRQPSVKGENAQRNFARAFSPLVSGRATVYVQSPLPPAIAAAVAPISITAPF